ncbi:Bromodomain-containing protein [Wallemia mellicola]|uniref:Bromodomain-containing protein n=1 Tax=Wallemia mellicola TaxID=1708541 RepID=A0A4T0PX00_9BASI|nr:Bromodomain-containing protein [Wallemia mellicola]TIC15038.1 Bromodomain-containing protein [Wallemia mellicola]TIC18332.1 Bromodomain-containing protein [Wallemia mellicola]TIC59267.1 Bromodomain-containing protein [Wallemia mellicola]
MSSTKYLTKELENYDLDINLRLLFKQIKQLTSSHTANNNHQEWFDTLDKVIHQLRSSPNSIAFHKPVRKFEAPDYHQIIKHPMDLSTISKKIKSKLYSNKLQFKYDLDLIWSNCLVYNVDPNHPLRSHAIHLRTKSNQLLDFVAHSPATTQEEDIDDDDEGTPLPSKFPHKKRKLDDSAIPTKKQSDSPQPFSLSHPFSNSKAILRSSSPPNQSEDPYQLFYTQDDKLLTFWNTPDGESSLTNFIPSTPSDWIFDRKLQVKGDVSTQHSTFNQHLSRFSQLIEGTHEDRHWGTPLLSPLDGEVGEIDDTLTIDILRRVTIGHLAHAGFASSYDQPLEILVGLLHRRLGDIAHTLKEHSELYSDTLSPAQIIEHTLTDHSTSVDSLRNFLEDDMGEGYTNKLDHRIANPFNPVDFKEKSSENASIDM